LTQFQQRVSGNFWSRALPSLGGYAADSKQTTNPPHILQQVPRIENSYISESFFTGSEGGSVTTLKKLAYYSIFTLLK